MINGGSILVVKEIKDNIHYVGARDWNRRIFDALIPLPKGTSYNAYLIKGEDKNALIDTVNPGFENILEANIKRIIDIDKINYVVMNHAEPDHAGSIPYIMALNGDAKLVTTKKGATMAEVFYKISQDRIHIVGDGDTLDLGGKTLRFIEAPMLHWPETMFTYAIEDKILFPCDFFGSHVAQGFFDNEIDDLEVHAQRYFGEIMMPFRVLAKKALEKIESLDIDVIAPSHGPIYRNPKRILEPYQSWSNGETKQKVAIIYTSMWGSTEKMVKSIVESLQSNDVEVVVHNLVSADTGELAKDLVDSRGIVLGAPTVLAGAHPLAVYASFLVKVLRPPTKYIVILSSYGWFKMAANFIKEFLGDSGAKLLGEIEVNGPPTDDDLHKVSELGNLLAKTILSE